MSKQETIQAYIRGDLDRRSFVAKLVTLGVSAGAAAAYSTQFSASVAAATPGGFVVRAAQSTDADYGTTIDFGSDGEAIDFASTILDPVDGLYNDLSSFGESDFGAGVYKQLADFSGEVDQQNDVLRNLSGRAPQTKTTFGLRRAETTPSAFLKDLESRYDLAVDKFVGVVPAVEAEETRQTLADISHAVSRQAGVVSYIVEKDGTPDGAFEEASK